MKPNNPFLIAGYHSPEFFCDRKAESSTILEALYNGRNITLIAPRRMGKTGLIHHVFYQLKEQKSDVVTLYMDIYSTQSLGDFVRLFANTVLGQLDSVPQKALNRIGQFIRSCRPVFTFDEITGTPKVTVDVSPTEEESTLKEIFDYLGSSEKRCYIAIDEFQQIAEFKDSKIFQKRLRSVWQLQKSASYCLFGSKKHLMNELFEKKSYPFYKFGDAIYLSKIGTQDWIEYIYRRFEATGKHISKELAEKICLIVDNHSSYVQQLAWLVWIHTDEVATEQDFEAAYQDIIDQNTPLFEKQTESLTTYQMNFLRAVVDGVHSEFTTQEILHKYQLSSSANVSIVKRALVKKELIEIEKRQVVIPDPVMVVWLKRELGM